MVPWCVVFLADEILDAYPWDTLLVLAVLGAVALVPLVVTLGNSWQRKRTERLRAEFGDDYDEALNEYGNWRTAERALMQRRRKGQHTAGRSE